MARLEEVANNIRVKQQIARNLQVHAWYMKVVRESSAYDIEDYQMIVSQGLYRHRGTKAIKPDGFLEGQSKGRIVVYKVVDRTTQELAPEKTFDVAVFIKDNLPFKKLTLDFDEFSISNRMGASIIIEVPDIPEDYDVTFENKIQSIYNGNLLASNELVEALSTQAVDGFGANVPPGTKDATGVTLYHHSTNQNLNGPNTVYDGSNGRIPPAELIEIAPAGSTKNGIGPQLLQEEYAKRWFNMKDAAAADGITLVPTSAYRSYDYQAQAAREHGSSAIVAAAGRSRHGTGRAVDIRLQFGDATWNWLKLNAGRYGFKNTLGAKDPYHWSDTGR